MPESTQNIWSDPAGNWVGAQQPERASTNRGQKRLVFILLSLLLVLAAFACDTLVDRLVAVNPNCFEKIAASGISRYCNLPFLFLYSAVLVLFSYLLNRPRWREMAVALVLASCLSGIVCTSVRATTGRTRPCAKVPQGWYGVRHDSRWLVGRFEYNSFPSGHVATAAGFGGVLLFGSRRYRVKAAGILLILLMAWSRVFLRCHHVSDVIVAGLVGVFLAYHTWYWLTPQILGRVPGATGRRLPATNG